MKISVVVPVYNEKKNLKNLIVRLKKALEKTKKRCEIIFVDDHSTDGTWEQLLKFLPIYKIRAFQKQGPKGKAFSLVEGFEKARGEILVMIDSDLQYPPEAIPQMVKALKDADIVVANRKAYGDSTFRKILSRTFKFAFGKAIFGLNTDIQSGLKAIKREVFQMVKFQPKSQWTFDLEFLHRANQAGFKISSFDISFNTRKNGSSSINVLKTAWEIGSNALILKTRKTPPFQIPPTHTYSMQGAGVAYKKQRFITHSTLAHHKSALNTLNLWQKLFGLTIVSIFALGLILAFKMTLIALIGIITLIYFIDVLFNAFLIFKSLNTPAEISFSQEEIEKINDKNLPIYTVLCPLYKEADVLPHFAASIESLDWPKDKLEVLLLLEEDDVLTQKVAENLYLPKYFKTIIVPKSNPKTKPKACNYGLHYATGKYLVIFDAEDRPDPLQLKKAHLAFEKYGDEVACFQARLNYYNTHHNLLTRFFTAEYSLWFGLILPGLQSIGTAIPLGGTSNHFRTKDIHKFEGWDPFNVTEDADLGVRLFKAGFKTAIIDSTTYEEANSRFMNWMRQRSRWIKGYMQTYLVHNRDIFAFVKDQKIHALLFQLIVGGKIAFIMINPIMWATTIAYFVFRPIIGETIEQFFPAIIFYMAAFCLVAGNFLYVYYYMIAAAKQEKFNLVKFVFLIPFYWLMISTAFWIAAYQLVFKPHYWEKTVHGLHFNYEKKQEEKALLKIKAEQSVSKVQSNQERFAYIRSLARSGVATGGSLIAAAIIANFLNFLYNAYLSRKLSVEDFGLISLVSSFLYLSVIPTSSLTKTVTHKAAYLLGKYEIAVKDFWAKIRKRVAIIGLATSIIWLVLTPFLAPFFKSDSYTPFFLFAPVWFVGLISAVDTGFLSGNLKFKVLALVVIVEASLRLLLSVVLVESGLARYVYAAIPVSMTTVFLIGWFYASRIKQEKKPFDQKTALAFPVKFFVTAVFTRLAIFAFLSLDLILAKHYLPPKEAGEYALLSLAGKMIFFIGSLFSQFINPLVSRAYGAKRPSAKIFYKLFFASTLSGFIVYVTVGIFGSITIPLLLGNKVQPIIALLPVYGLAIFTFTIASNIVLFYQVRRKYAFAFLSLIMAAAQVIGIYLFHGSTEEIVKVMSFTGIGSLVSTFLLHLAYEPIISLARNSKEFLGLFSKDLSVEKPRKGLNVLIFNWRDTKHAWAGGAEVYIHEIAKRLVKDGNRVTVFCGNDSHSPSFEIINKVQVIRKGGTFTVYVWAFLYYIFRFRGKFDAIIDSENGIPFFTPLYATKPVIGLVHHIHQEVFRTQLKFPLSQIGRFLEGKMMPFVYRNIQMVTVSNSSKEDMEKLGLGKRYPIQIIHPGVDLTNLKPDKKTRYPSIIYLGRLKPYKSLENIINILPEILKKIPNLKMFIAGEGESRPSLEKLVHDLSLKKTVQFLGRVEESVKASLLAKSWLMVQPSMVEGWGITVIEANASGTPVIASDVPGLRDSVKNPHSGLLITWDNKEKWTNAIVSVLTDKKQRNELEKFAKTWGQEFSWEKSTEKLSTLLSKDLQKKDKH